MADMTGSTYDATNFVQSYLDVIPSMIFIMDEDVRILNFNRSAALTFSLSPAVALHKRGGDALHCLYSGEAPNGCGTAPQCTNCVIRKSVVNAIQNSISTRKYNLMSVVSADSTRNIDTLLTVAPVNYESKICALVVIEDVTELTELRKLLPICAWCKKIRNDNEYWERVDTYFSRELNIDFTHGICPECAVELSSEINKQLKTPE